MRTPHRMQMLAQTLLLLLLALALGACSSSEKRPEEDRNERRGPSLRVGVATDYPPIIFEEDGRVTGLEADLARRLADELGARVEFVKLDRGKLLDDLQAKKLDIVMAGMSITQARLVRAAFTQPYLGTALAALRRTADAERFDSVSSVLETTAAVGVERNTTADIFVENRMPNANKQIVGSPDGAVFELKRGRIDLYIGDVYSVIWLATQNEADLAGLWEPLDEYRMAWALHSTDLVFRNEIDKVLARWKADGSLEAIVRKWIPYYDRVADIAATD